jgi:hypothetical protein
MLLLVEISMTETNSTSTTPSERGVVVKGVPSSSSGHRDDAIVNAAIHAVTPYIKQVTLGGVSGW